jgi:cell division septation protein DedD
VVRWATAVGVGLLVVLLPGVASAAGALPANGHTTYQATGWATGAVTCDVADCSSGVVGVSVTTTSGTASTPLYMVWTSNDPTALACWPNCSLANYPSRALAYSVTGQSVSYSGTPTASRTGMRWFVVMNQATAGPSYWVWDLQAPATSSAAPTTSAAPAPTSAPATSAAPTSVAPTTTAPAPTTSAAPTTASPTPSPAPATTSPAAGATTVVLDDSQWSEVLMALGSLVFFSVASFVASLRKGR